MGAPAAGRLCGGGGRRWPALSAYSSAQQRHARALRADQRAIGALRPETPEHQRLLRRLRQGGQLRQGSQGEGAQRHLFKRRGHLSGHNVVHGA